MKAIVVVLAFAFAARALAVDVSGPVVSTTTWFAAQSPYRVTADVSVQGGATLSIEPGVAVIMLPGTSLSVDAGALRALGTAASPIVFTSAADAEQGSPAPGNWGAIRFHNGTNDASTVLEHVTVRYGQGIVVESAAPALNFITLADNSGAAISIDLNSSPIGIGLQASGNGINGVAVPAGEITGSVLWGLQGIPYVVSTGRVSVGRAPTLSAVAPNQIAQGQSARMTVNGTRLQGVESVRFDNTALSASIVAGGSDIAFAMDVTATAEAATGLAGIEVQVAAGKVRLDNAVTVTSPQPPITVTSVTPASLRRGDSRSFQAVGTNMAGASVATSAAGLTVSNTVTTATTVNFTLSASTVAALGDKTLTFTNPGNASGSATAIVAVLDLPPTVVTSPAPVAVPPDNIARLIKLRLSRSDSIEHSFAVSVSNDAIATVTPANVVIAAGQAEANLLITGKAIGQTVLTLVSPTLGTTTAPIFVTTEFSGLNTSFALPLGVVLAQPATPPAPILLPLTSNSLGVALGNYLSDINPKVLGIGSGPVPLVISGAGLGAVTAVSVSPAAGITVGAPSASEDGTSVTVPVTIAADAPAAPRQVVVTAGTTRYVAARADADRIQVANASPVIDSVTPLFGARGVNNFALTLRGRNFQNLQSVSFVPAEGIVVAPPVIVNADGTLITLNVNIAADAPLGPRVVVANTLGGTSPTLPSQANTFTLASQVSPSIAPIIAPQVGVLVEQTPTPPPPQAINVGPLAVGVTLGSAVTAMSPVTGEIGTSASLSLQGSDLGNVTAVQLVPATGVTVGTPQIAPDGRSLTVDLAIAADAPQNLRTVKVLAGNQQIAFALQSAALFRVTPPLPRVDSVNPLFLQIGAPLSTLTLNGVNFQNASQVRVLPAEGITVATPVVNASGSAIAVGIAAAAGAAPGPRVVSVLTPAGESSTLATIANTLTLAANAPVGFGPFATAVGVVVEQTTSPPSPTQLGPFASPSLGVVLTQVIPPVSMPQFAAGSSVGVAVGPFARTTAPGGILAGQSGTLTISGSNLAAVTGVTVLPATGISLGAVTVSADGTQLSVPITVAAAAPSGARQVALNGADGPVRFTDQGAARFVIVPALPVLSSISPILGTQGQLVSLLIRASDLQFATGVSITPAAGVTFSRSFTVNNTGTELTISVSIGADAPTGARVIQVLTPAGATPAEPSPANTFTIRSP